MDHSPPPPIVPTPAAQFPRLRGRRVIVGVPGLGFRGDLRADDPVVQDGRTYVPVLTEQDYYRAEIEEIEAIAPLVPVERVWVEQAAESGQVALPNGALDAPPWSNPRSVLTESITVGQRVVQAVPDGFVRDLRTVSQVYVVGHARAVLRICGEHEWYKWALTGTVPSIVEMNADRVWLE
jgi:hypothetical protein